MSFISALTARTGWRGRFQDLSVGALGLLGHAPLFIWPVTILSFTYLCLRLDAIRSDAKQARGRGLWWGLGYFMANIFWVGSAFLARGAEFIPLMPPMVLGLAFVLAIFVGFAGWAYAKLFAEKTVWRWVGLVGLLWFAEFLRGHVFGGFPWNLPGYIFKAGGMMSQSASLLGIYGLSFIVLVLAGLIAFAVKSKQWLEPGLAMLLIGFSMVGFGRWQLSLDRQDTVPDVTLRLVQYPFSQKDKFDREKSHEIVLEHMRQSLRPGIKSVTHLVWPEGAVVGDALNDDGLMSAMNDFLAREDDTPPIWLFNSLRTQKSENDKGTYGGYAFYNTSAAIMFDKEKGHTIAAYNDKHRLVPFGEFIPGGQWVEDLGVKIISASLGSITPAEQKELADFPGLPRVSPQICYETNFSGLTPRDSDKPAEWILNQTNDAWFGQAFGPWQHANISAYRSIEEGLPMVRSASNGVTGIIDGFGRYVHKLGPNEPGVLDVPLPTPRSGPRLRPAHNLSLLLLIGGLTFISALLNKRGSRQSQALD